MTHRPSDYEPIIIKKYSNRRLYNTSTSVYITLEDLCEMIQRGEDFKVYDSKSNEDLTRQTLTQIIFEQEAKGYNLLPENFLKHIIRYYNDPMTSVLPKYLESSMDFFSHHKEQIEQAIKQSVDAMPFGKVADAMNPMQMVEEISKQNMKMFEQMMQLFSSNQSHTDKNKE